MDKKDLINYSPVRSFDNIADGGLKAGEIGLVTAKKGVGKTAILVQFGLDALLKDEQLVHVSFDQHSSNVISWYDSIFTEISKKKNIADNPELKDSIMRDRMILNFNQETFSLAKVINTLKSLKAGGIAVSALVIDGMNMDKVNKEDIEAVSAFVKEEKMTAWFSDTQAHIRSENAAGFALCRRFVDRIFFSAPRMCEYLFPRRARYVSRVASVSNG